MVKLRNTKVTRSRSNQSAVQQVLAPSVPCTAWGLPFNRSRQTATYSNQRCGSQLPRIPRHDLSESPFVTCHLPSLVRRSRSMSETTELKELARAIGIARHHLYYAFEEFVSGQTNSVSAYNDLRYVQESLTLLEYLTTLSRILLPLNGLFPELLDTCLPWTERRVTRLRGEAARKKLQRALTTVHRMEGELKQHVSKGPPIPPSCYRMPTPPKEP